MKSVRKPGQPDDEETRDIRGRVLDVPRPDGDPNGGKGTLEDSRLPDGLAGPCERC